MNSTRYRTNKKAGLAALFAVAILASGALMAAYGSDATVTDGTYGEASEISIPQGCKYMYTPEWPSDLSPTVKLEKDQVGSLTGNGANNAIFDSGTLTVTVASDATVGTQYHVVLKATTTNPSQTTYIYIVFTVTASVGLSLSDQGDIVLGDKISITSTPTGGKGTLSYTMAGNPKGCTIDPSTGAITGTPTEAGSYTVTVTVTDTYEGNVVGTATASDSFTVYEKLTVSDITQADVVVNDKVTITPSASIATGVTWSVTSGELPEGCTIDPSTGVVSGTVTAKGTYSFTLTATHSESGQTASVTVSFEVVSALIVQNSPLNGIIVRAVR